MNFLGNFKIVMLLILTENFFYKYYIGANFFTDLYREKVEKGKIALNFAFILGISSTLLFFIKKIYHMYFETEIAYLILLILSTYFSILIYTKIKKGLEKHLYYAVNNFLLLSIIENRFDSYMEKGLAIALIPLFYYLNLVVLEPLLKSLNYKKSSVYVKKEALVVIVIAIVGLLLNAFEGL